MATRLKEWPKDNPGHEAGAGDAAPEKPAAKRPRKPAAPKGPATKQ